MRTAAIAVAVCLLSLSAAGKLRQELSDLMQKALARARSGATNAVKEQPAKP